MALGYRWEATPQPRCKSGTHIFKDIAEKCNELFVLDLPSEECVDSHAQFILC